MAEENLGNMPSILESTTQIVASYLRHNPASVSELPTVIRTVRDALASLGAPSAAAPAAQAPVVPVRKSVHRDHLVCLECGAYQKTLKRHLSTAHGLTPELYREKWNLPDDYPMVAADYAAVRSELAKKIGLGRSVREAAAAPIPIGAAPKKGRRRRSSLGAA
jgi:predicted transcriptional regulator